jgi:hypothetical protein
MEPGYIGKSNTNNLPAPTNLTENPYGEKKHFFRDATQKSASLVLEYSDTIQNSIMDSHGGRFLKNVLIFEKKGGC